MMNVVHVHSDTKFISGTSRFIDNLFNNTVIIIGKNTSYSGPFSTNAIFKTDSSSDLHEIISICTTADLVVLYDLDIVKSYIAINIDKKVKIAWRFFGYELYKRNLFDYLTKESLNYYHNKESRPLLKFISNAKCLLKYNHTPDQLFNKSLKRINYFLGLSIEEHELLSRKYDLPYFIQLPFNFYLPTIDEISPKINQIIIGNSRSIYNNHIDILNLIENLDSDFQIKFLLPFNYGSRSEYTLHIEKLTNRSKHDFVLIQEYMESKRYFELISSSKAAIYNGYRQMAMGNILTLLAYGVKVYLNINNVMYTWFKNLQIKISTTDEFLKDLKTGQLELTHAEKQHNLYKLKEIQEKFNLSKFAGDMYRCVNEE